MIKFVRIDHRLLHGQVVFAWINSIGVDRVIVIDTPTAGDEFKKMSLKLSKPANVKLSLFSAQQAIDRIGTIKKLSDATMLIFGNVRDTYAFFKAYGPVKEINYGGLPDATGKKRFSSAIYLSAEDIKLCQLLKNMGINQYMQQIPTAKRESLNDKL